MCHCRGSRGRSSRCLVATAAAAIVVAEMWPDAGMKEVLEPREEDEWERVRQEASSCSSAPLVTAAAMTVDSRKHIREREVNEEACCASRERERKRHIREREESEEAWCGWVHVVGESTQSTCEPFRAADWSKDKRCTSTPSEV
jgi:hypothetical protein